MSLSIVSCKSFGAHTAEMLETSCAKYGLNLNFYEIGQFVGFRQMKLDRLIPYLKSLNSELVMYTDSTDSWILNPNIEQIYKDNFDGKVVVSGNRDHYPHTNLYSSFPEAPTSMRYICCSQFIGPREKVINTLETIQSKWTFGDTDQEGWHYCFVNGWGEINIDYYCKLFLNMTNVSLDEITPDLIFKETGNKFASWHFGGPKAGSENGLNMKKAYEMWKGLN